MTVRCLYGSCWVCLTIFYYVRSRYRWPVQFLNIIWSEQNFLTHLHLHSGIIVLKNISFSSNDSKSFSSNDSYILINSLLSFVEEKVKVLFSIHKSWGPHKFFSAEKIASNVFLQTPTLLFLSQQVPYFFRFKFLLFFFPEMTVGSDTNRLWTDFSESFK